jgi:anaerobic selenocysteine-containing dehydrogenase
MITGEGLLIGADAACAVGGESETRKMNETATKKSFCRNCGASCGIELEVQNERVLRLRGDRSNPISKGYFCIKGNASRELQNGSGRLLSSQKRVDGAHRPIAVSTALDEVAERLSTLVARHGAGSVGLYYGTGAYGSALNIPLAKGWAKSLGTSQVYSSQTIDQSPKAITALRMGAFKSGRQPLATSDVFLLSGSNPLVSHLGGWGGPTMFSPGSSIREAKKRGMKFIVIDPRLTETARLADIHLQPKPGQDVVVHAALLHVVLNEGLHDTWFCSRYTSKLEMLREALARFTPEYAAQESGVPAAALREAARVFGSAQTGSTMSGTGANMAPHANLAEHLLECLNVVCGRYRRAGDRIISPSILSAGTVREGVHPPYPIWDHSPKMASHPDVGWAIPNEYPTNLLADEILHTGENRLRALVVTGGNPIMGIPDYKTVKRAFGKLEILVTLDVRMSETAKMSDYVLSCKTPYERADLALMTDGNAAFPAVQYTQPICSAPGDALEEWAIFHGLAQRMGFPLAWEFWNYGSGGSGAEMVLGVEDTPTTDDLFNFICRHPALTFSDIKSRGTVGIVPEMQPSFVEPPDPSDDSRLDLLPDEVMLELNSSFETHQRQCLAQGELLLHVRRLLEVKNSNFIDSEVVLRRYPQNPLYVHPDDLAGRGISAGERVEVRSSSGRLTAIVKADSTQRHGTVSMHHSWGTGGTENAPVTALVSRDTYREAHNFVPRMSAIPVTLTRIEEAGAIDRA